MAAMGEREPTEMYGAIDTESPIKSAKPSPTTKTPRSSVDDESDDDDDAESVVSTTDSSCAGARELLKLKPLTTRAAAGAGKPFGSDLPNMPATHMMQTSSFGPVYWRGHGCSETHEAHEAAVSEGCMYMCM